MKKLTRMVALVLAIATLCAVNGFAARTSYESSHVSKTVGDYTYSLWSVLYIDSKAESTVWVSSSKNYPKNYAGAEAVVYGSNGNVVANSGMIYNSAATDLHIVKTPTAFFTGMIRGGGSVKLYSGVDYEVYSAPYTVYGERNRAVAALASTLANGEYPVNENGETYGSLLLANITGSDPDLIAATGVDGTEGYIRSSDINPEIHTPEEAEAYMETLEWSRLVPLYDVEGNVIGNFLVEAEEVTEEELDQIRLERALPVEHVYPVNQYGETYGTAVQAAECGCKPDLIGVVATNGKDGYVLAKDFYQPEIHTLEEAEKYMRAGGPVQRILPVFNINHEPIGEFIAGGGRVVTREELIEKYGQ